ncbi:malate synthase [Vibrio navarrensis]|uniref:Malate synthase n=1 Tax=Vibrio navarrensis TaxID=29495 RepID=A0A099LXA8_9VIBR|nr:malate synthase [Vibrio navarrensis]KGK12299.1 malate synthase [Vibrio navarrensis]MBE4572528.1 malate synthase [Vibrio navarrensis]MBE4581870.1 malate synthase [Vibrio navarrensis]MBE4585789.1 malate synthase [Vibrio navarrensis]MBE4614559.1 malate synthase [Vibrio navarrensis]
MNMLRFDKNDIQQQHRPFIAEAVFAVEAVSSSEQNEKQLKAKQLLDRLFPLENGSHQDVTSYVIDYRHLMAYFADGTHSGLRSPKHFVAFTGGKEDPCSILLRDETGSHVEVMLGYHKGTGCVELIEIDDIQLETRTTFSPSLTGDAPTAMRHWISLVKGDVNGKPMASSEDKEYTAKNGEDYILSYCYSI